MITDLTVFSGFQKPLELYNNNRRCSGTHITIRNFSTHPLKVGFRLSSSNLILETCETKDMPPEPDRFIGPTSHIELVILQNGWKLSGSKFQISLCYHVMQSQTEICKKLSTWFCYFDLSNSIINDRKVSYFRSFSSEFPEFETGTDETMSLEKMAGICQDKMLQLSRYALQIQDETRFLECYAGDSKFAEIKIDFTCRCTKCLTILTKPPSDTTLLAHSLHEAVLDANAPKIVQILTQHTDSPDSMDFRCRTPLHLAAKENFFDIARLFLEHGANKNARDMEMATPLIEAAFWGSLDVVKLLINEFNQKQKCDLRAAARDGRIALHEATLQNHHQIVKLFLEKDRTIVNTADAKGYTPLHLAAECGSFESVKILLDNYADPKLLNSFGATVLHLACRGGHTDIVDLLMHKCRAQSFLNVEDNFGFTPMRYAIYTESIQFISALEKYGAHIKFVSKIENRTALHDAAEMGSCDLLGFLASDAKFYVDVTDRRKNTPMHIAAYFGYDDFIKILIEQFRASTSMLTSQGATAFFLACQQGHAKVVKYFLQVDAYLMHIPIADDNRLPIHYAIYNGHEDIVALMIEYGVDVLSSTDARRKTVFDFAVQANRSKIAEMLIKALKKK